MSNKTFYIESYGCAMNFADSEIVNSILMENGNKPVDNPESADIILVNTCSIRENAEAKIWNRLKFFRSIKKQNRDLTVGVLGCMAERVRERFLEREKLVDLVVGPDAYREIPSLLAEVSSGQKAVNVILSLEETYADITPVRRGGNGVTAFVSIMRGCDNMCSFCVVPFTRGRERSRATTSILDELTMLSDQGYKEVTLLGQNVNSFNDDGVRFAELMYKASLVNPEMRIRFSTSHPKDFPDELLHAINEQKNLCNYIHIPAQSGNNEVLRRMRRPYSREQYLSLLENMREIIPGVTLSTDIITGFCGETEEEHHDTLSLMDTVRFEMAYLFAYSERERTLAHRKFEDDVPQDVKQRRLQEIIDIQRAGALVRNQSDIGRRHLVLVENESKRSADKLSGRTDTNKVVILDRKDFKPGDYVEVVINDATSATLFGEGLRVSSIQEFEPDLVQV
ncbi:MAG: tRNA (N6-isopentenyl adenosine(37)-C2)-methylthiotransferase MiaB [Balneolales bacterium]|nr:tRNA (N6-isopentenyl adenosine(37)-C2)-methylthiotransferase MiaB [Balneolales bacterium]